MFCRLGVERTLKCQYCQYPTDSLEVLAKHLKDSHSCQLCGGKIFQDKDLLILHLKRHLKSATPVKEESQAVLREGFYHPTLKQPDKWTGGVSILKQKQEQKPKTQYFIYKDGGKVRKVVKKVYKKRKLEQKPFEADPLEDEVEDKIEIENEAKEDIVSDGLSCNLDDLLKTFEEEESESSEPGMKNMNAEGTQSSSDEDKKSLSVCETSVLKQVVEDEMLEDNLTNKRRRRKPTKKGLKKSSIKALASSNCLLCQTKFANFSKLLFHITHKHLTSEVNEIITKRYPGFWRAEKLKENNEFECGDCGHKMSTRGQLQNHLGVDHNLVWDKYLERAKTVSRVDPPRKSRASSSPKQTTKNSKGKKGKQKQSDNLLEPGISFYKDFKLSLIPDENPYSKKFLFGNKGRNETYEIPRENTSLTLLGTIANNVASSLEEPYCSVCQILLEPEIRSKLGDTPTRCLEKVPDQSSVWLPQLDRSPGALISKLLVCRRCKVCVHKHCYNDNIDPGKCDDWTCDKCQETGASQHCVVCAGSEGALRKTTNGKLAHLVCARLVPEAVINPDYLIDISQVPRKRTVAECVICGESGAPVVHCHATRECQVKFHVGCALKDNVDIVIGSEPGSVVMRCSFCVDKHQLSHQHSSKTSKYLKNDLEVGESVTVTRPDGQRSIGVILDINSEEYFSVAFDDGTYCDSLEPHDVNFVDQQSDNCPVNVSWEGGLYTGVFKGSNIMYWYKVQTVDQMDILEVERKNINKNT